MTLESSADPLPCAARSFFWRFASPLKAHPWPTAHTDRCNVSKVEEMIFKLSKSLLYLTQTERYSLIHERSGDSSLGEAHMGVTQEGALDYDLAEKARQDCLEVFKRSYQLVPESSEFLTLSHIVASVTLVPLRCATLNITNQNMNRGHMS